MADVKIVSIEAVNFMALQQQTVDFSLGDVFIVKAGNGKGKSTLGESLFALLQSKFPAKPLKDGEAIGYYKVTLDDGTIIKYQFDKDTKSLTLHDDTGKKISDTNSRAIIKRLIGDVAKPFDMDAFLRETAPAKQRAMIQAISGIDLSDHDIAVKAASEARTEANRKVAFQKPRIVGFDASIAAQKLVDSNALMKERDDLRGLNQERNTLTQEVQYAQDIVARKEQEGKAIDSEIADLEQRLKAAKAKRAAKDIEIATAAEAVKTANEKLEAAPVADPAKLQYIEAQLANASSANAEITKHKALAVEVKQLEELQAAAAKAEAKVKETESAKLAAIKAAQLPGGLEFDPNGDGLLLKGFPLSQSCSADLTICALQIKAQERGDLPFIAFDGSNLDYGNTQKVIAWLKANDLQAFIEKAAQNEDEVTLTVTVC